MKFVVPRVKIEVETQSLSKIEVNILIICKTSHIMYVNY
jgi:hypothetical protein